MGVWKYEFYKTTTIRTVSESSIGPSVKLIHTDLVQVDVSCAYGFTLLYASFTASLYCKQYSLYWHTRKMVVVVLKWEKTSESNMSENCFFEISGKSNDLHITHWNYQRVIFRKSSKEGSNKLQIIFQHKLEYTFCYFGMTNFWCKALGEIDVSTKA